MICNIETASLSKGLFCLLSRKIYWGNEQKAVEVIKGRYHILQSMAPKDHRLCWVTAQLVLPRVLAGGGISILVAKANPSMTNPNIV